MSKFMYDLIVIGGSGGVRAARISAGHGARVALVETSMKHGPPTYTAIGGTCVNVGCVPKKLFVYGSHFAHDAHLSESYGWAKDKQQKAHEWKAMLAAKDKEITRLNGAYGKILANAPKAGGSMQVIEGYGSLVDANTVKVTLPDKSTQTLTTNNVIISVGGWPRIPDSLVGKEHVITSNEAFYLPERPNRVLIVGGGYIAVEFAGIFNGFGSHVIQMYRGPLFLRGFDDSVREFLLEEMRKRPNMDIRMNANPKKIEKLPSGALKVTTETGDVVEVDCVMYATGRSPKLEGLGVEKLGLKVGEKGQIVVDEWNRTNVPNVYAVGDCTERVCLTPVALREGHLLADALFGDRKRTVDYDLIPSAVFSQPEIGTVGLTEAQAVAKYQNVTIFTAKFKAMKYTMDPDAKERALFKLIVDDATDKVVGMHAVSDGAGEMIQGFAVALKAGATKQVFDDTIGIHPTSAEEFVTMRTPSYRYVNGVKQSQL